MKDWLIIVALSIIMVLNAVDVYTDIGFGVPFWHIVEEGFIVLLSGVGAGFLIFDMRRRTQVLNLMTQKYQTSSQKLQNITEKMQNARHQYAEIIHQQFDDWHLTDGEQQVALLLLKGFSFKEMAVIRGTKEKTIRQQASAIYAKANVDGRHEFSAWFLEDFLQAKGEL